MKKISRRCRLKPGRIFPVKRLLPLLGFLLIMNSCLAFDTWWHAECTRKAMTGNGFSSDARLVAQFSNYLTDYYPVYNMGNEKLDEWHIPLFRLNGDPSFDYLHFDAVFTTTDIEQNWKLLFENTVRSLLKNASSTEVKSGYRLIVLMNIIGSSLHTVQDFYSHSNWVNLHSAQNNLPVPTWYDVSPEERAKMKLFTGAYPDGSSAGHKNHADLNKDCSTRNLNKEAVNAAERASIDWVKRLIDSAGAVPWDELRAYNIQSDIVMKKFLITLDANFLTTSSILINHFDGPSPAKFVFSPEKDLGREKRQAAIVLISTVNAYTDNRAGANNVYRLPSPYWAGYDGYHITRDLASGLLLNGKKYTPPH